MTVVIAAVAALLGFLSGPILQQIAERAIERDDRALAEAADWPRAFQFSEDSLATLAVRIVTAGLAAGVVGAIGIEFILPAYLWFVVITVIVTVTDLRAKLIPDRITWPAVVVGLPLFGIGAIADGDPERVLWGAAGALIYGAWLLISALIAPKAMGFGDVKLAPFLGWYTAGQHLGFVVIAVVSAHLISGVFAFGILLVGGLSRRKTAFPFGQFMVIGAYVALFAGQAIVDWYLT